MSARAMSMNDPQAPALPRYLKPVLSAAALLAVAVLIAAQLGPLVNRPVAALRVEGTLTRLKAADIVQAADPGKDLSLFNADLDAIRERIEALPWVAQARVSRVWPELLAVKITERKPFARWGEARLIDTDSRLFTPPAEQIPNDLPLLTAPPGHEAEAAAVFQNLQMELANSRFTPSGLSLDVRGEWRMSTVGGIELRLGQGDPQTQLALILGAVTTTLNAQLEKVAYVDLRYSNGFSVGWKDGVPPSAGGGKPAAPRPPADGTH